jgi:phage tail-like protein
MPTFVVNPKRYDPYKNFRFQVFFEGSSSPIAALSKVTTLKRSTSVIEYNEAGRGVTVKGLGRTKYEPITMERGITRDKDFIKWADTTQQMVKGEAVTSLKNLRRELRILLNNEAGQVVLGYVVHACWVSEFQALPDLDASGNVVALEHIKVENEGWEVDSSITEVAEI